MKKVIPQQIEIYCDRCGVLCTDRKHQARIVRYAHFRDHMWEWHEAPQKEYDLCDDCFTLFDMLMSGHGVIDNGNHSS